jgi:glycosyltransferase involved in cell wall biosynthesis
MNVLVYIPKITQEYGGVKQYTYNILGLLNLENENSYYVFSKEQTTASEFTNLTFINIEDRQRHLIGKIIYKLALVLSNFLLNQVLKVENIPFYKKVIPPKILDRYKIDIVYCPIQLLPSGDFKKIFTIHDLQELHFPSFFSAESRKYRALNNERFISEADLIVTSYEHIKSDIIKFFDYKPEKIVVLPHSFSNNWFDKYVGSNSKEIRAKYNLPDLYFLYPAATWEHKNHIHLLKSLKSIKDIMALTINLVCTGDRTDYFFNALEPYIIQNELEGNVRFTGIVDDLDLYCLYRESYGVIIPTRYEAGSFPLYESIFMGIPVICSNTTSLPETIGDQRFVFDPTNIGEMSNKIYLLYSNEEYRKENISNSIRRAEEIRSLDCLPIVRKMISSLSNS